MENFRRTRAMHRSRVLYIFDQVKVATAATCTPTIASCYKDELDQLLVKVDDNHDDIAKTCSEEDLPNYMTEYHVIVDHIYKALSFISPLLAQDPPPTPNGSIAPGPSLLSNCHLRPPRIELPTFDGSVSSWPTFAAIFMDGLNAYPSLTGSQKLLLLANSLKGDVKNIISFIQPSATAFDEAWNLLKTKFENETDVVCAMSMKIFNLPMSNTAKEIEVMVDTVRQVRRALTSMGFSDDKLFSALIIPFLLSKIAAEPRFGWKQSLMSDKLPSIDSLLDFLQLWGKNRAMNQKAPQNSNKPTSSNSNAKPAPKPATACPECKKEHIFYKCPVYNKASIDERWALVKKHNLCSNCLSADHKFQFCQSKLSCKHCSKKHNTSLHKGESEKKVNANANSPNNALLATAVIYIKNNAGKLQKLRAMIDGGSTLSFISQSAMSKLNITPNATAISYVGVSGQAAECNNAIDCEISTSKEQFQFPIQLQVVPKLATDLPTTPLDKEQFDKILKGKKMADPSYHKMAPVDVLLGVDIYAKILLPKLENIGGLILQQTKLGWILFGSLPTSPSVQKPKDVVATAMPDFSKFWEIEDIPAQKFLTPEEEKVERHFVNTVERIHGGRYQVRLPLKEDPPPLGASRFVALKRFQSLENKFKKDEQYRDQYSAVMDEYFQLDHIEEIRSEIQNPRSFYIPHHAVKKEGSSTPLRIVFDASAKGSLGQSLNDQLLNGPVLQNNIFNVLTRFRTYQVALSADIQKMYRQISVHEEDRDLQRVLWRPTPDSEIKDYRLKTVTFGVKTAPYLAIRVLHHLAQEAPSEQSRRAMLQDFYVDDLLTGANSETAALQLQKEIDETLASAGFITHKWVSSIEESQNIPQSVQVKSISPKDEPLKTLGILWDVPNDTFSIQVTRPIKKWSRRTVLSATNELYDPLGFVAPITLTAKIILQDIVKTTTNWDLPLSKEQLIAWKKWTEALPYLQNIRIPRCIFPSASSGTLIGFADASERAYGVVVYVKTSTSVMFVAAKTKVAPLKQVSLPRLELMAAVLLTTLLQPIYDSTHCHVGSLFSDCHRTSGRDGLVSSLLASKAVPNGGGRAPIFVLGPWCSFTMPIILLSIGGWRGSSRFTLATTALFEWLLSRLLMVRCNDPSISCVRSPWMKSSEVCAVSFPELKDTGGNLV